MYSLPKGEKVLSQVKNLAPNFRDKNVDSSIQKHLASSLENQKDKMTKLPDEISNKISHFPLKPSHVFSKPKSNSLLQYS